MSETPISDELISRMAKFGLVLIGRCKDCKHSDLGEVVERGFLKGHKNDQHPRGDCHHDKMFDWHPDLPDDSLEGAGYECETSIGPMFGCVHWEAKSPSGDTGA